MWDLNDVTSVEYRQGYVYHITFDDGVQGDVDFSEYIGRGPVFEPLAELSFFKSARVEGGTISWPNGADIAPETLYEEVERANAAMKLSGTAR
ncbi:MAG: DUF2442 domain-containing protein [Thermoguttaceae bacterium]|jgi:hypothetical protein